MTQSERRQYLIRELLCELPQYRKMEMRSSIGERPGSIAPYTADSSREMEQPGGIAPYTADSSREEEQPGGIASYTADNSREMELPGSPEGQKRLLRSLMNVRPPRPVGKEFLKVQDEYLSAEVREKGITDSSALPVSPASQRLALWRGDITTLKVDAIVNAANCALRGCFVPCHSCVDNIIHSVSGIQLRLACDALMREQGHDEPTGQAKITPAFNLPCRYVLHTVGPIVQGQLTAQHCRQLAGCYRSCMELAAGHGLKSIAFCCISTGEFHFPQKRAAEIAVQTVAEFLRTDMRIEKVIFNVYKESDETIYRRLLG